MFEQYLYLSFFVIACLIGQALFINGVYVAASGETTINPDGSEIDSEMILYPINKMLHKHTNKRVYYTGVRLQELVDSIVKKYAPIDLKPDKVGENYARIELFERQELFRQMISKIEADFNLKIDNLQDTSEFTFYVYAKEYAFSKYLRKPTFGCIKCMPSIWGTLSYFFIISFFSLSVKFIIGFWIADIFALVPLSYYINKKFGL